MPYLLLVLGLLIGFYAFSRYFVNASSDEIKILVRNASIAVVALSVMFLALTGRLGAGLVVILMFFPMLIKMFRKMGAPARPAKPPASSVMSESEALNVLGLEKGASPDDIQEAYIKLMQKVHPDNEGTDWMATKLNQARDRLVKG